jgi:hypothetical protein
MVMTVMWRCLAAFLFANTLIVYVASSPAGALAVVISFLVVLTLDHRNGLLLAATFLVSTVLLEATVRFSQESAITAYYRPHERLANDQTRAYHTSQRITMQSPHGDLLAIDPLLDPSIAEPRELVFVTDSLGFRNSADYAGERLILVGDSFVVGNGNSQDDTLTSVLRAKFNIAAYNVAFPDGPHGYALRISEAKARFGDETCVVVIMFEGNDFRDIEPADLAAREMVPGAAQEFVKWYFRSIKERSQLSRVVFGLYTRGLELYRQRSHGAGVPFEPVEAERKTFVGQVGGRDMAFLAGYASVVKRDSYSDLGYLLGRFAEHRPDHIVFVPDKYRVYAPLLDVDAVTSLPNSQWEHLDDVARALQVPVLDLTPALHRISSAGLPDGLTTFWRDDTHWNKFGISVAAEEIVGSLRRSDVPRCRAAVTDGLESPSASF